MKYLISGIAGFLLTLVVSLPFQNILKQREAKALTRQGPRSSEVDVKIQPLVRLENKKDEPRIKFMPQYPFQAAAQKIEGSVTLTFRVSKDGSVQNLKVTQSYPPQIFDEAAMEAVSKWSFAKKREGVAKAAPAEAQQLRLNFTMGKTVAIEQRSIGSGI